MAKLFLQRHLKSQWNQDNRFAGWTDGPLAKDSNVLAKEFSKEIGQLLIDAIYCSAQFRNMDTVASIFENIPDKYPLFIHLDAGKMEKWGKFFGKEDYIPAFLTESLNERYYGKLQGLDKKETMDKYGQEQVKLWRRSYNVAPPGGESLKDVCKRVNPFFKKYIEKDLRAGKNILIVASHNSLRAVVKYIENISDKDIINLEIPFGALAKYEFDGEKYKKFA